MSDERLLLDSYLKTLKLPTMRAEYKALARKCSQANAAYEDFLQQLAELEVQHRTAAAIERRLRQAGFPMVKEMSSYKFADVPKLNKKYVLDLARCQFIETKTNLVLKQPLAILEYKLYTFVATDIIGSAFPAASDAPAPIFKYWSVLTSMVIAQIFCLESLETGVKREIVDVQTVTCGLLFRAC